MTSPRPRFDPVIPHQGYTISYSHDGNRHWEFTVRDGSGYAVHWFTCEAWRADVGVGRCKAWIDTALQVKAGA